MLVVCQKNKRGRERERERGSCGGNGRCGCRLLTLFCVEYATSQHSGSDFIAFVLLRSSTVRVKPVVGCILLNKVFVRKEGTGYLLFSSSSSFSSPTARSILMFVFHVCQPFLLLRWPNTQKPRRRKGKKKKVKKKKKKKKYYYSFQSGSRVCRASSCNPDLVQCPGFPSLLYIIDVAIGLLQIVLQQLLQNASNWIEYKMSGSTDTCIYIISLSLCLCFYL